MLKIKLKKNIVVYQKKNCSSGYKLGPVIFTTTKRKHFINYDFIRFSMYAIICKFANLSTSNQSQFTLIMPINSLLKQQIITIQKQYTTPLTSDNYLTLQIDNLALKSVI